MNIKKPCFLLISCEMTFLDQNGRNWVKKESKKQDALNLNN